MKNLSPGLSNYCLNLVGKIMGINFKETYQKFSKQFWLLMFASFIDMLGGALIFPFFSLYLTQKFNVGMVEVGTMFLVWALTSGVIGNTIGGALADKFGRKTNMIMGLVASATSALLMVVINDLRLFYIAIAIVGIFEDIAGPARQAMIADLVPEKLRPDAYGLFRIIFNLAVTIGPALGGFIATRFAFTYVFIIDVVISLMVAVFVFFFLKETKPEGNAKEKSETFVDTFKGYGRVLKDKLFMAFIVVTIMETLMYFQMNSTLGVFLVNFQGITTAQFGTILSINAAMVVLMQMFFTRLVADWKPLLTLALGNIFYVIGFSMFGYVSGYPMFILAMVIITIGEMIIAPVSQSVVASFAPESMRARYMALFSFAWIIPVAIGPLGAGLIMDHFNPRLLWFVAGFFGLLSTFGFFLLHKTSASKFEDRVNGSSASAQERPVLAENS